MKEEALQTSSSQEEKQNALSLDAIDIDYTTNHSLVDQVTVPAMSSSSGAGGGGNTGAGDTDFLLGDMGLYFNEENNNSSSNNNLASTAASSGGNSSENNDSNTKETLPLQGGDGDDSSFALGGDQSNAMSSSSSTENKGISEDPKNAPLSGPPLSGSGQNELSLFVSSAGETTSLPGMEQEAEPLKRTWHSDVNDKTARQSMILEM